MGALLLLVAESRVEAKSLFAGVPSLGENKPKSYMQLTGRILLVFMFVTMLRLELSILQVTTPQGQVKGVHLAPGRVQCHFGSFSGPKFVRLDAEYTYTLGLYSQEQLQTVPRVSDPAQRAWNLPGRYALLMAT